MPIRDAAGFPSEDWKHVRARSSTSYRLQKDSCDELISRPSALVELNRDFHFACPATKEYTPECPARAFFAFVPTAKPPSCPAGPLPRPKSHDLPHSEAISRTLLRQLPSFVQIGFAWLPRIERRETRQWSERNTPSKNARASGAFKGFLNAH